MTLRDFVLRCYQNWIQTEVPPDEILGNCTIWSRVMKQAFPELIHVGGYVQGLPSKDEFWSIYLSKPRKHYHEYLRTPDGDIVDPTGIQFGHSFQYCECEEHLIQ